MGEPKAADDQQDKMDEIIDELEQLEKEISASAAAVADEPSAGKPNLKVVEGGEPSPSHDEDDELADFRGPSDEPSIEETLGGLPEEEPANEESVLAQAVKDAGLDPDENDDEEEEEMDMEAEMAELVRSSKSDVSEDGTLSMTLKGNMTLELSYAQEGQSVKVGFKGGFLMVQLSDGTEFKIPVKKAA